MMSCSDALWNEAIADDPVYHAVDVVLREPIEAEGGHVMPSSPGGLEFRPERHYQQRTKILDQVHRSADDFKARGINPMHVFEDHEHRSLSRQRLHLYAQRVEGSLPTLRRRQVEHRIASVVRK
jgi:hypothetical protein